MRVISKSTLRNFWLKHADVEQSLLSWYQEASKSTWQNHNDLKIEYPSASILPNDRIVFNIKGNSYRLIIKISYIHQTAWIRFIGTHAEYDKINAKTI